MEFYNVSTSNGIILMSMAFGWNWIAIAINLNEYWVTQHHIVYSSALKSRKIVFNGYLLLNWINGHCSGCNWLLEDLLYGRIENL